MLWLKKNQVTMLVLLMPAQILTTLGVLDLSALGKGANRDGIALALVPIRTLGGRL